MSENRFIGAAPPGSQKGEGSGIGAGTPPETKPEVAPAAPKQLTAEEQMALYEKSLKEDDWGHQPC